MKRGDLMFVLHSESTMKYTLLSAVPSVESASRLRSRKGSMLISHTQHGKALGFEMIHIFLSRYGDHFLKKATARATHDAIQRRIKKKNDRKGIGLRI